MKEFSYVITDALGLHARPAGQLAKAAMGFTCSIALACNGKTADAKRIMAVMQLAAKQGQTLTVTCDGPDETQAAEALETYMKETL